MFFKMHVYVSLVEPINFKRQNMQRIWLLFSIRFSNTVKWKSLNAVSLRYSRFMCFCSTGKLTLLSVLCHPLKCFHKQKPEGPYGHKKQPMPGVVPVVS